MSNSIEINYHYRLEASEQMFVISLVEAILTNFLLRDDVEVITSFEDYFGQEMLVYQTR